MEVGSGLGGMRRVITAGGEGPFCVFDEGVDGEMCLIERLRKGCDERAKVRTSVHVRQ